MQHLIGTEHFDEQEQMMNGLSNADVLQLRVQIVASPLDLVLMAPLRRDEDQVISIRAAAPNRTRDDDSLIRRGPSCVCNSDVPPSKVRPALVRLLNTSAKHNKKHPAEPTCPSSPKT